MTQKAGERLFEVIGGIPEEFILEAERDSLHDPGQEPERYSADEDLRREPEQSVGQKEDAAKGKAALRQDAAPQAASGQLDGRQKEQRAARRTARTGQPDRHRAGKFFYKMDGMFKYIPIAACLCVVCGWAFYVVSNFHGVDRAAQYSMSGAESGADVSVPDTAENSVEDQSMSQAQEESDEKSAQTENKGQQSGLEEPLRYDDYEGPVMAMTATGDTQKIRTSRTIKNTVVSKERDGVSQPLLRVEDCYRIRNTSREEKTLQLVYPFAAALSQGSAAGTPFFEISGQDETAVSYSVGESMNAYWGRQPEDQTSIKDYLRLSDQGQEYQEHALEKEVDWNQEVRVYSFVKADVKEDAIQGQAQQDAGVIGVTVSGADADVLTYGFDYSAQRTEETADYCFFAAEGDKQRYLVITAEAAESLRMDAYTNLDCVDRIEHGGYRMQEETMSYADALRMCSRAAMKQIEQYYEQGILDPDNIPPQFLNADSLYQALTANNTEEEFYDRLVQRYGSSELWDAFEKLMGETRILYALSTITILPGQSVQVTVRTQKSQAAPYTYDYLPAANSHLNIKKTVAAFTLSDEWRIAKQNMGLEQKKGVWRAVFKNKLHSVTIRNGE